MWLYMENKQRKKKHIYGTFTQRECLVFSSAGLVSPPN